MVLPNDDKNAIADLIRESYALEQSGEISWSFTTQAGRELFSYPSCRSSIEQSMNTHSNCSTFVHLSLLMVAGKLCSLHFHKAMENPADAASQPPDSPLQSCALPVGALDW
jgi:hypothetical protein